MMDHDLATERQHLHKPEIGDYAEYASFWKSEGSSFITGRLPDWGFWLQFSAMLGHWSLRNFGWWTLLERASGKVVGWMGLFNPPHDPDPELGWILTEWAEGKGFATEAALAVRDYAQTILGMDRIVSYFDDEDVRSKRLAACLDAKCIVTDSFLGKAYHLNLHGSAAGAA
ncbi:MAG: GNAT family N-acetyltransferase [Rhodobacterales bacterium]|nr:GNAT family N-acetyltransferase [Rhodobacterales bacterium]